MIVPTIMHTQSNNVRTRREAGFSDGLEDCSSAGFNVLFSLETWAGLDMVSEDSTEMKYQADPDGNTG